MITMTTINTLNRTASYPDYIVMDGSCINPGTINIINRTATYVNDIITGIPRSTNSMKTANVTNSTVKYVNNIILVFLFKVIQLLMVVYPIPVIQVMRLLSVGEHIMAK